VSALATVEVTGGDPLVVEIILPPAEARVVEVVTGLAGPPGPAGGGILPWQIVTASMTLENSTTGLVLVQHAAPLTVGLPPAPLTGQTLTIKDAAGNSAAWPVTISGPIEGAASLDIAFNWSWVSLAYAGTQWVQV